MTTLSHICIFCVSPVDIYHRHAYGVGYVVYCIVRADVEEPSMAWQEQTSESTSQKVCLSWEKQCRWMIHLTAAAAHTNFVATDRIMVESYSILVLPPIFGSSVGLAVPSAPCVARRVSAQVGADLQSAPALSRRAPFAPLPCPRVVGVT